MSRPYKGVTFWDRVHGHTSIDEHGCHLFTGHRNEDGYGRIHKDGKLVFVHRAVWERDHGAIPAGMLVCHRCDIPACINIEHLFIGTQTDNMRDMMKKGRGESRRRWGNTNTKGKHFNVGSKHGSAIFTEDQVRLIKQRLAENIAVQVLADQYSCSYTAISHIKRGTRWKHV